MYALRNQINLRHVILAVLSAGALFAAVAAIPSGVSDDGPLANVAPQTAQAYEGGFDRDHYWVKVSAGDIAGGVAQAACRQFAGPAGFLCPLFSQRASEIVGGSNGVWAELYTDGRLNVGTW